MCRNLPVCRRNGLFVRANFGLCRGIALTRALGIPARFLAAYAPHLQPPDFHAIFEVWLDNGWWLVDPTRLAPVEGLVRIACGRDAADIAFLTTQGRCELVRQTVTVARERLEGLMDKLPEDA